MIKLAVAEGEGNKAVLNSLCTLFKMADVSVFSYKTTKYQTFRQLAENAADVFVAPISYYLLEQSKSNIDILIFSKKSYLPEGAHLNLINENATIIINADDRKLHSYLKGTRANLLTYGFNPKASVTASSIEGGAEKKFIQLCIQRSFKTINDMTVEAQEIPITFYAVPDKKSGDEIVQEDCFSDELAAITAALACGVNYRTISLAY